MQILPVQTLQVKTLLVHLEREVPNTSPLRPLEAHAHAAGVR